MPRHDSRCFKVCCRFFEGFKRGSVGCYRVSGLGGSGLGLRLYEVTGSRLGFRVLSGLTRAFTAFVCKVWLQGL